MDEQDRVRFQTHRLAAHTRAAEAAWFNRADVFGFIALPYRDAERIQCVSVDGSSPE
jgi:hypothetical protein